MLGKHKRKVAREFVNGHANSLKWGHLWTEIQGWESKQKKGREAKIQGSTFWQRKQPVGRALDGNGFGLINAQKESQKGWSKMRLGAKRQTWHPYGIRSTHTVGQKNKKIYMYFQKNLKITCDSSYLLSPIPQRRKSKLRLKGHWLHGSS